MKKLYLGQIPDNFFPYRDVAFAIGCFVDKESVYPEWEYLNFVETFQRVEEQFESWNMLRGLTNDYFIPKLGRDLNEYHHKNFSIDFWSVLLKPWLLTLLNLAWLLYSQLTKFIEENQPEHYEAEVLFVDGEWYFKDTLDFIDRGYRNIYFHHWILSQFLMEISPKGWLLQPKHHGFADSKRDPHGTDYLKAKCREGILNFLDSQRCTGVYGMNRLQQLLFSLYLELKPVNRRKNSNRIPKGTPLQGRDMVGDFPPVFLNNMERILKMAIPGTFMKDFYKYDREAQKLAYRNGAIRLVGPRFWYNEQIKFYLAHAKENGEKIVCTQHGGTYGTAKIPNLIPDLEYCHEAFFSWGWEKHNDFNGNIFPLPSPYLYKLKKKVEFSKRKEELVLVGAHLGPLELRFDFIQKGKRLLAYRREKVRFLSKLSPSIFERTYYRPVPGQNVTLRDKEYLKEHFSSLKFCEGEMSPHPQMLQCKLLVLDHPIATLHISLAANIPTICFWDKRDWAICEDAASYFKMLEDSGVIYHDGESAAEKVNMIWDHVEDWWNSDGVQKARKTWCWQYARTNRSWWWEWMKAIWRV